MKPTKLKETDLIYPIVDFHLKKQAKEIFDDIEKMFRMMDDADYYICGCGCNQQFDFVHGFAQQIENGINKITMKYLPISKEK